MKVHMETVYEKDCSLIKDVLAFEDCIEKLAIQMTDKPVFLFVVFDEINDFKERGNIQKHLKRNDYKFFKLNLLVENDGVIIPINGSMFNVYKCIINFGDIRTIRFDRCGKRLDKLDKALDLLDAVKNTSNYFDSVKYRFGEHKIDLLQAPEDMVSDIMALPNKDVYHLYRQLQ